MSQCHTPSMEKCFKTVKKDLSNCPYFFQYQKVTHNAKPNPGKTSPQPQVWHLSPRKKFTLIALESSSGWFPSRRKPLPTPSAVFWHPQLRFVESYSTIFKIVWHLWVPPRSRPNGSFRHFEYQDRRMWQNYRQWTEKSNMLQVKWKFITKITEYLSINK